MTGLPRPNVYPSIGFSNRVLKRAIQAKCEGYVCAAAKKDRTARNKNGTVRVEPKEVGGGGVGGAEEEWKGSSGRKTEGGTE